MGQRLPVGAVGLVQELNPQMRTELERTFAQSRLERSCEEAPVRSPVAKSEFRQPKQPRSLRRVAEWVVTRESSNSASAAWLSCTLRSRRAPRISDLPKPPMVTAVGINERRLSAGPIPIVSQLSV